MDNSILNAALEYAAKGWSVIPISKTKEPLIKWKNASREYLTNPDNIKEWWDKFPAANVAIVTGERSGGLVVIDLDVDDTKGINGVESLKKWCEDNYIYEIESDASVYTGRGGRHLYFQSNFQYHNHVGCLEGVDIRGEGGCVVAPPSIHGSTRREYLWDIDQDDVVVPEADSDVTFFLGTMETEQGQPDERGFAKNNFAEITNEGGRNDKLFKYASRLQGDGESDQDIIEYVKVYNVTHLNPPLDDEEVQRTIESVLSHKEWKGTSKNKQEIKNKERQSFRKLKTAKDLMKKDLPEPKVFIGVGDDVPLLVEGTCILSAKPKLGKSWLALSMCLAVSNGDDFLGYKTQKCSTLYLDLETSEQLQQKRLRKALNGKPVPENFFLDTETDSIENGFVPQIEAYLEECPDIGLVVVDVFQIIRSPSKNVKESEYDHAYRDITPLNELAQKHHISIILVCHDRKAVDPDDPFSNILGSTGLQGAATQMMVMFKRKAKEPIHISVKGKTIDGLPELNVELKDAKWTVIKGNTPEEREQEEELAKYKESEIRAGVIAIINKDGSWKGRCQQLINYSYECDSPITEEALQVGRFLGKHRGRFLKVDDIRIDPISNGTGPKIYKIYRKTIDTIDKDEWLTIDNLQKSSNDKDFEVPFL